ncbi:MULTISPECIES: DUF2306 domain-containing protein [Paenibacillus]|uniref:DUF2306 domain-containing protein n=1 Tax=Paenibacillus TaxID=44249 RepID=UPI000367EF01|nr:MULTISPECIES: DUF2306 domain-containing protein [Paenibacillus]
MNKSIRQLLYMLLLAFALIYTIYTLYLNLFLDPGAADFLIHKTEENRPQNIPLWLNIMYIHVIAACLAMVSGALNFSSYLLRRYRRWHRVNGYLYIFAVLIVDLTSGYLAPYATGSKITSIPFNLVNIAWLWITITALVQIKRGNLFRHRRWMVRSYVFCFTNMFIHGISLIGQHLLGMEYRLSYICGVYGAIVVNIVIAEFINRTLFRHPVAMTRLTTEPNK